MKQERSMMRLTMLLLFAGVVAYFGIHLYSSLNDPFYSVLCYSHRLDRSVEAIGYVIRDEMVLPRQNGMVDILLEEGEKVAAGETVAMVYRDASALDRKLEVRQLELELEQLEYSLRQDSGRGDVARLDRDILEAVIGLRADTAAGDFSRLEESAMQLKSMVFHRSYTYNNNAESVESITAMINEVSARLQALKKQTAQGAVGVKAPEPGIYSGQVDGFEELLTVGGLDELTVSQLDHLQSAPVEESGQVGKLITASRWYFAAVMEEAQASQLRKGDQVTLRFSREYNGEALVEVERIGPPEEGRMVVVFSSARQPSAMTLLRKQRVEIIFDSTTGIRVPKTALRAEEVQRTDPTTGIESTDLETVVYVVVGRQAERKPVVILAEEEDYFLVKPEEVENQQNSTALKKSLRAGDEVIVTAKNLYDGKVIKQG